MTRDDDLGDNAALTPNDTLGDVHASGGDELAQASRRTLYSICTCQICGPPWRESIPKPTESSSFAESLSWHSWMSLCPRCGWKRCPGASDHRNDCKELAHATD